ncbi:PREDICTED: uncharacterized protein LOC109583981 [Amphimedon queenslandica]|uniref:Uncharacterized protein n=1 Tax=Amphimedon queenslandica TaxID=400682 RepID=A0AAN0JEI3_AMPQE|nr:PREDICTED: uncharacterized protein LOC109583981 [Amphimedon queenslandica]|eukprot:XP_019855088.1 PREDICTED: uncharacterized protein LOC109583981 [Amphimedon queenslandica]
MNSSFTSTNDGRRLLNEGVSISDFKGLYSHRNIDMELNLVDVTYLFSYIDFYGDGDFILPGTANISGTYTCRSSSGNYSQTISVNTRNPSGLFSRFFFRFTAFFANISQTVVDDKDYELVVLEANIFYGGVVDGFNSTINPIRTISCHFVPLMEEDGTGDRVECDVREYPPNSSFKRLSNDTGSNTYSSSTFESKDNTLNEKSVLAKLSEADNENALPPLVEEDDDGPADLDSEKKNGDLDLVQLKGARVKRHSTRKHTRHVEQVDVDFYDSDEEDAYEDKF